MARTVGAGQTLTLSGALAADQTVTVDGGTPSDPRGGVVEVATRATNNGTLDLLAGPDRPGTYRLYGAMLQVTGTLINVGVINLAGGAYGLGGDGQVIGALMLDQGMVTNLGSIAVGGGMAATPPHAVAGVGAALDVAGVRTNRGQISIAGSDGSHAYAGTMSVSGTLFETAGTLIAQAGITGGNGGQIDVAGYLHNSASISIAGGDDAHGGTLNDNGLLVNAARLTINGPRSGAYTAGTLNVEAPATLENNGVLTDNGSLTLDGSGGDYDGPLPAAYLASAGDLINADMLTIQGGDGRLYEGSIPSYFGTGATLNNTGLLTNTGHLVVDACSGPGTSGVLVDAGSLANSGTMTLYGSSFEYGRLPTGATFDVTGVLTNTGLLLINGGIEAGRFNYPGLNSVLVDTGVLTNSGTIALAGGQLIDSATLVNSGVISVAVAADGFTKGAAGLSLTSTGTLMESGTISGAGEVLNQGNIVAKDSANLTVASLVNDGRIAVMSGSALFIGSDVTGIGTGVLGLQSAATLTLAGSVQNQLVAFAGADAALGLGDAAAFAGVLAGLAPGDAIDFLGLDVTSAHASGTTLAISEADGANLDLNLAAPLPAGTGLMLRGDHHGGTDLLVLAPGG